MAIECRMDSRGNRGGTQEELYDNVHGEICEARSVSMSHDPAEEIIPAKPSFHLSSLSKEGAQQPERVFNQTFVHWPLEIHCW
jgi:hypothetical protein